MRISTLLFISDLIKLCILTSASRLVIRVLDVREVSYPDSSSSDSSDDLDIFNHSPVASSQNRGRDSRAAARSSSASSARAGRGFSGAARASTTASTGSTSSRAGGVLIDSASFVWTSSGTPSSTSNGARQDSSVTLSGTAAASSTTTSSNGSRQSSATFSSTNAAASSSSGTSASGGAAVSSATSGGRGTGISRRLQMLGGFVWDTPEKTGIRDSARATAIIGILQLAASHPQGYLGSIGTNGRTAWFAENSPVLFQHDGPLGCFNPVSNMILMRHFSTAQRQARELFNQRHSSDQSGAGEEDIPLWARHFFRFFEAIENNPSASAQAAEVATQRRNVVSSVMGRQAPLGHHPGTGPVQLLTETRGSNRPVSGSVRRRQQSVGDFETEILGDNVEGVDDTENRRPAQRSRTQLHGTRRRNVHNPGADTNEANSRYFDVNNAFQHLGGLTDAVAQAFINPPPPPRRTATDIINDFSRSSAELHIAETRNFTVGIAF